MFPTRHQVSQFSEKNEDIKTILNKITFHFRSEEFPHVKNPSNNLDSLGNKSTNDTSVNRSRLSAKNKPLQNHPINHDLAQNFAPPSKQLTQDAKTIVKPIAIFSNIEEGDFKFDANEDPLMKGHLFGLGESLTNGESSSLIDSLQSLLPRESQDLEEHKHPHPQENRKKPSILCDCRTFLSPAAEVLGCFISKTTQRETSAFRIPWIHDRLLAFLIADHSDEYIGFLRHLAMRKDPIKDAQSLLTLLNYDNSLAFLVFSFNLLKSLETDDDRLSKKYVRFSQLCCEKDKLVGAATEFTSILWTIFEARVNHSLAHFEFKVNALESFPIFNPHLGVRQMMKMLLELLKSLRTIFRSLPLEDPLPWQPQNLEKFERLNPEGSPKYAKFKLCTLLEDVIDFMSENEWVLLLKLPTEKVDTFERGFHGANNLIRECLKSILKMIENKDI